MADKAAAVTAADLIEYFEDRKAESRMARLNAKRAKGADGNLLPDAQREHLRANADALIGKHDAEMAEVDRYLTFLRGL